MNILVYWGDSHKYDGINELINYIYYQTEKQNYVLT